MDGSRVIMATLRDDGSEDARVGAMMLVDAMHDISLIRQYIEAYLGVPKNLRKS